MKSSKAIHCMLCTCGGSQALDRAPLAKILGDDLAEPATMLCRTDIGRFQQALNNHDRLLVACEQEMPLLQSVAESDGFEGSITFTDIRDQAGWSDQGDAAGAKIAALIEAAKHELQPAPAVNLTSNGACVIYGAGQAALDAAHQLAARLDVTLMLCGGIDDILLPVRHEFAIMAGRITAVTGALGSFSITIENPIRVRPTSRDIWQSDPGQSELQTDILVDLSGGTKLVASPAKHDGYERADPGDPAAVQRALFAASDLVGEFEKPRYIDFSSDLCAHSRSKRTGCTRCLDACPTGAIQPAGDHVAIDPAICAGCGSCASLCPTGAASYQAPLSAGLGEKLRILLKTHAKAGGSAPTLLIMDDRHGRPLVTALARLGPGLPAAVLPITLDHVGQVGLDGLLAAFAFGASRVIMLAAPDEQDELLPIETNLDYANRILDGLGYGAGRASLLVESDPAALRDALDQSLIDPPGAVDGDYLVIGGKRDRLRLGLDALHDKAPDPVDLLTMPEGAPFGTLDINSDGCTLCLACVGACPTGALIDNPDQPMLRFIEDACVQCGLCQNTCPERVIKLEPRVNFTSEAKSPRLIKEEQPFECIRCGKDFGTKSTVMAIVKKLEGKHWMFETSEQIDRIKMCDDCRVASQFEVKDNPFAMGERPKPRTSDDYFREREEIEAARNKLKRDAPDSDQT